MIKTLLVDMYNKFDDVFLINIERRKINGKNQRIYSYGLCKDSYEYRDLILNLIRKKYSPIHPKVNINVFDEEDKVNGIIY